MLLAQSQIATTSGKFRPALYSELLAPNRVHDSKIMEGNSEFKYTNGIFSIKFDSSVSPHEWSNFGLKYVFSLVDALDDCPEYVVYWKLFER